MGIKLIGEVMDYAPETLTWRERAVLDVIAEDFNEKTRSGWPSYEGDGDHSEKYRRRSHCSRSQFYDVLKALVDKGVLEKLVRGNNGHAAKYRIRPLAPSRVLETGTLQGDAEPLLEGYPEPFPGGSRNPHGNELGPGLQDPTPGIGSRFEASRVPVSRTRSPHVSSENLDPLISSSAVAGSGDAATGDGLRPRGFAAPEAKGTDYDDATDYLPPAVAAQLDKHRQEIITMHKDTVARSIANLAKNFPDLYSRGLSHSTDLGLASDLDTFNRETLRYAMQLHLLQQHAANAAQPA